MARNFTTTSSEKIVVPRAAELDTDLATAMTVGCWFRRNGAQPDYAALASKTVLGGVGSPWVQYILLFNGSSDTQVYVAFGASSGGTQYLAGPGSMNAGDGVWYFVAGTFAKNSNAKFYYGAATDASLTEVVGDATGIYNLAVDTNDDLSIGAFWEDPAWIRFFNGDIANVGLWPYALTASELEAVRVQTNPLRAKFYAPLFGTTSPEPDWSGANNHGTLTGTARADHPPRIEGIWPTVRRFFVAAAAAGGIDGREKRMSTVGILLPWAPPGVEPD
ncbi:MAG TPA: LamG-like jellyroll fold domain-containing protein [Hyphomicrobiaceae bacterium]|nr:LamG-like jellyroll fold domain-containing protein [Hyphomicrobiaceae bacterium]